MNSNLYKLLEENFQTILAYYNITKEKAKKYYDYIIKYKEYTKEYYLNIKELFKEENISEVIYHLNAFKRIITIDFNNKPINNKIDLPDNNNDSYKIKKSINILPIQKIIDLFNQFFRYKIQSLKIFIDSIDTPLNKLQQIIEQTQSDINSIKNDYINQKEIFFQKYSEFDLLNKTLKKDCMEGEQKLIEYVIDKKLLNGKNVDKEKKMENEVNLKLIDIKKNQKIICKKFSNLGNFGKIFNDLTNEKINAIKSKTSILFQSFEKCITYLLIFYKKSFLPINEIKYKENDIDNKNEFKDLLKKNIKEIDEKIYNINFDEYQIGIIKNKNNIEKSKKSKNDNEILKDYELIDDIKNQLEEEDIFFIVKKMYNFNFINKNNYIINIEKEKLELKKIINKLISYSECKNKNKNNIELNDNIINSVINNNNENTDNRDTEFNDIKINIYTNIIDNINEIDENDNNIINSNSNSIKEDKITQEEVNYICKSMNVKEYRLFFLTTIYNLKSIGAFNLPEDIFNYFIQIFKEISKYFYVDGKNENDKILDLNISKLTILLSQTFYYMKNDKKIYLQNELSKEKIYLSEDFWKKMIKQNIETEIENCKNIDKDNPKIENDNKRATEDKRNNIIFSQIIPRISEMSGFGLNKDTIKGIILPFLEEYNINEENKKILLEVFDNKNNI